MSLNKFTAPPNVPEIINFLNDSVDEFDTKLDATATAVDSDKLGGTAAANYAKLASPTFTGTPKVPTAGAGTSDTQAASTAFVQQEIASSGDKLVPVGTIIAYAANANPEGYVLCNGANVSRETYADLFAVIGTLYGEGDGSTTFTLPNLTDRFIEGSSTAGSYYSAGLPNINGWFSNTMLKWDGGYCGMTVSPGGCFNEQTVQSNSLYMQDVSVSNAAHDTTVGGIDASLANAIFGASDTVQPASLTMRYYVKY